MMVETLTFADDGAIPANVLLAARARGTAGFANDVDAVNQ